MSGLAYFDVDKSEVPGALQAALSIALRQAEQHLGVKLKTEPVWITQAQAMGGPSRERAQVKLRLRHGLTGPNEFQGMASVFNVLIDSFVPTIIEPGAFEKTLKDRDRAVLILWQHDSAMPIGTAVELTETREGLEIVGRISNTAQGRDALTLMRDGVIKELSIGFDAVKHHFVEGSDEVMVRHITEAKLWEVSLVSWGANREAKISEVNRFAALDAVERMPDPRRRLLTFGEAVRGCCKQARDGTIRVYISTDLTPAQVISTVSHELQHVQQFEQQSRAGLSDAQRQALGASMEVEAHKFGDDAGRRLAGYGAALSYGSRESWERDRKRDEVRSWQRRGTIRGPDFPDAA